MTKREKLKRIRQRIREVRAWIASASDAIREGDYGAAAVRAGFASDEASLARSALSQLSYESEYGAASQPKARCDHGDVYPAGDGTWRYNGD